MIIIQCCNITIQTESESQHSRKTTSEADDAASKQWEHVDPSSLASSLPSMSFPEDPASTQNQTQTPAPPAPAPPTSTLAPNLVPSSATLSILNPSLSPSTRLKALFSSLAINLLLPFVNGVMLGFGEIFAKNVVGAWLGWNIGAVGPSGRTAAQVGVRKGRR